MGEDTAIAWCDHTFNPWRGCTEVSPGCDHCYARELVARFNGPAWGAGATRVRTSPAYWRGPLRWNKRAAAAGVRERVFCASLADWADAEVPREWVDDLFALIRATPSLDWLLLTKRPNRIAKLLPEGFASAPWPNVWLGTSVESQDQDWRVAALMGVPAAVRFLSCEPLLGPLNLDHAFARVKGWPVFNSRIDWVIIGGESGPGFRPMDLDWPRSLVNQCRNYGIACFYKQGSALRAGQGSTLDGQVIREWPRSAVGRKG